MNSIAPTLLFQKGEFFPFVKEGTEGFSLQSPYNYGLIPHIIVETGNTAPDDYYESLIKAGVLNIVSSNLAEKLAPSAGLRYRLVHDHDRIDHSMVHKAVNRAEELYP